MIRHNKNNLNVIVGNNEALVSALPAVGTVITGDNLATGATVLVDSGMRRLAAGDLVANGGTTSRLKIVKSYGPTKPLIITHDFDVLSSKLFYKKHMEAKETMWAVGYNPATTSGVLPSVANGQFYVSYDVQDEDTVGREHYNVKTFDGIADATGTQGSLAISLANSSARHDEDSPEAEGYVKTYAVVDVVSGSQLGTGTIVKGANTITAAGALITAINAASGLDTILSFQTSVTINGTATTVNRCYGISSIDAANNTVVLTQAILEASGSAVSIDEATGTNFGVVMEATPNVFDVYDMKNYTKSRFLPKFSDSTTPVSQLQAANDGHGTGSQAMYDEFIGMGIEGQKEIGFNPHVERTLTAKNSEYSVINVSSREKIDTLITTHVGGGNMMFYTELTSSAVDALKATTEVATLLLSAFGVTIGTKLDK
jgi:hypothetical protein